MGRVFAEVQLDGQELWAIFDTGSRNSYVVRSSVVGLPTQPVSPPQKVGLGGTTRVLTEGCNINATIESKRVFFQAFILDDMGTDLAGRPIQMIFGALAMQQWGIRPLPDEERLDLSHYSEEWIEY